MKVLESRIVLGLQPFVDSNIYQPKLKNSTTVIFYNIHCIINKDVQSTHARLMG
jgi:hypothetical protein